MSGLFRKAALAAFGLVALAGCTPASAPETPTAPVETSDPRTMSEADKAACTSSGGRIERRGLMGADMCVRPYADAGKQCTDSSQCGGKCIGSAGAASDPTAGGLTGQCQADDRLFGCYAEIKGGKAAYTICVD